MQLTIPTILQSMTIWIDQLLLIWNHLSILYKLIIVSLSYLFGFATSGESYFLHTNTRVVSILIHLGFLVVLSGGNRGFFGFHIVMFFVVLYLFRCAWLLLGLVLVAGLVNVLIIWIFFNSICFLMSSIQFYVMCLISTALFVYLVTTAPELISPWKIY